jgi:eukaryotic sulfide quinone oxidoreductase
MLGIKRYSDMLTVLQQERGIVPHFKNELVAIDSKHKMASFKNLDTGAVAKEKYDLLHVVPFMSPPACVKSSKLAAPTGFVEVDQATLQSTKYKNVFALGDCTTTPNSKTAAAITTQAPILVYNMRVDAGDEPNAKYNGYASCPLIVGKNEVILAEFGYGGKIMETFSKETGKFPYSLIGQNENRMQGKFFYWMKETVFPYVYWNLWPRGRWFGNSGPFKPDVTKEK